MGMRTPQKVAALLFLDCKQRLFHDCLLKNASNKPVSMNTVHITSELDSVWRRTCSDGANLPYYGPKTTSLSLLSSIASFSAVGAAPPSLALLNNAAFRAEEHVLGWAAARGP